MTTQEMAKIFKALSNEQRLNLFKMLYYWNKTVPQDMCAKGVDKSFTRACDCMNISRSTISHHFKELENAGLITRTRNGQFFCCSINKELFEQVMEFFK